MTLRRSQIVAALQAALASTGIFPMIEVDAEDIGEWVGCGPLQHAANLLSGKFTPTIDSGPENQWEGVRDCTFVYAVAGADPRARAALRDQAVPAVQAILQADRTIGTGDPQVWAEIGETTEDDNAPLADAGAVSLAQIGINVLYVAASAAG